MADVGGIAPVLPPISYIASLALASTLCFLAVLGLQDFTLELLSFEIRYAYRHELWDRAGELWARVARSRESMRVLNAAPGGVVAADGRKQYSVEMEKAFVIHSLPGRDLKAATVDFDAFYTDVITVLGLSSLTRAGTRLQFKKEYRTAADAADALRSLGVVTVPEKGSFGVKNARLEGAEFMVTWKGTATGAVLRVKTEERHVQFTPAPAIYDFEEIDKTDHRLVIDFDFFTVAPMTTSQLRPADFVHESMQTAKRNIATYIKG